MATINKRKVFWVFSASWVLACCAIFFLSFADGLEKHEKAISDLIEKEKFGLYEVCLAENNLSYSEVLAQYGSQCQQQVQDRCSSPGWCAEERIYTSCIRASVENCMHHYAYIPGKSEQVVVRKSFFEQLVIYLKSHYSNPLKAAFLFSALGMLSMFIFVFFGGRVIRWFQK